MSSSDEKKEMRDAAKRQADDTQKKQFSAAIIGSDDDALDRQRDRTPRTVQISREQAEKNIPSDPDPDDPVSP